MPADIVPIPHKLAGYVPFNMRPLLRAPWYGRGNIVRMLPFFWSCHMFAQFNRFEIQITLAQAAQCSHSGPCDDDVAALVATPAMRRQLAKIAGTDLATELREYGAWDDIELSNREDNNNRIVWIAAGNIVEEYREKHPRR